MTPAEFSPNDIAARVVADQAARIRELEAENKWTFVEDGLPELNENLWSAEVLLAYKVEGCEYHGQMIVSRYHKDHKSARMVWEYGATVTLEEYSYEAVAWRPLPAPPAIQKAEAPK